MPKFLIKGTRRETGEDVQITVDAANQLAAEADANAVGILVESVSSVHVPSLGERFINVLTRDPLRLMVGVVIIVLFLWVWSASEQKDKAQKAWDAERQRQERLRYR